MYQPASFRKDDLENQMVLVRANPLGMLISQGDQGLIVDPVPFLIEADEQGQVTLRAHIARANPHWTLLQTVQECLVVFQGDQGYISPGWYESKRQPDPWHREQAPANFIAAQMKGIVGIEIVVTRREGKWKMSQNRNTEDINGVITGLCDGDGVQQRLADEIARCRE